MSSDGPLTSVTDALGNTTSYVRNGNGQVIEMVQPNPGSGQFGAPVTRYQYDTSGDMTGETLPDGSSLAWQYATFNTYGGPYDAVTESIDELGHQTWYTINSATGDVTQVEQVLGSQKNPAVDPITSYTYTPCQSSPNAPAGLVASQTDPRGIVTLYDYNAHGLLTLTTYAYGTNQQACTQEGYDTTDQYMIDDLTSQTNELQDVTSYTYDDLGRVLTETEPVPASGGTAPTLTYSRRRPNSSLKPGVLMLIYTHVHTRWFKALLCFSEGQ